METEDELKGLKIHFVRHFDLSPLFDVDLILKYQVFKSCLSRFRTNSNQKIKVYFDNLDRGNCEVELLEQEYELMISQIDYKGITLKVKIEDETQTTWKCKRCSLENDISLDKCKLGCSKPQLN